MAYVYGPEAKSRISNFGFKEITAFLEKVPEKHREAAYAGLKAIQGFRKNESRELKERIKKLAQNLASFATVPQRAPERDWSALENVWCGWAQYNFPGAIADAVKNGRAKNSTFGEVLKSVIGESDNFPAALEDINELFSFSPFPSLDDVSPMVQSLPLRKDLEKKRAIARLPAEIAELKLEVARLKTEVENQKINHALTDDKTTQKLRSEVDKQSDEIAKFERRFLVIEELSVSQHSALSRTLEILSNGNEALSKRVIAVDNRVTTIEKSNVEIVGLLRKVEGVVKVLQKTNGEHDKERSGKRASESEPIDRQVSKPIGVTTHRLNAANIAKLHQVGPLRAGLLNNYLAIGIAESSARKLAAAASVALACGQFLQFSGSLADIVADATIIAVCGGTYVSWNVPAGLCDSEMSASVLRAFQDTQKGSSGLVLRGLNKSAFDIYGYDLRKIFVNRLLGLGSEEDNIAVVGTWLDSDSTLPERRSTSELGPIVDTNNLNWVRAKGELKNYAFSRTPSVNSEPEHKLMHLDDLSEKLFSSAVSKTELWTRTIKSALKKMGTLTDFTEEDATETLLLNWLFPWITEQATPNLDIESVVKEHFPEVQENPMLTAALTKHLGNFT